MNRVKFTIVLLVLISFIHITLASCAIPSSSTQKVSLKITEPFPDLGWDTINCGKIDIKGLQDRWIFICDYYSCQIQRDDILTIKSVYDTLYHNDLKAIVIQDEAYKYENLAEFCKENGIKFCIVTDSQHKLRKYYSSEIKGKMVCVLIDTLGNLRNIDVISPNNERFDNARLSNFLKDAIAVKIVDAKVQSDGTFRWETDKPIFSYLEINGKCYPSDIIGTQHTVSYGGFKSYTAYKFRIGTGKLSERITSKLFTFTTTSNLPLNNDYELTVER